MRARQDTFGQVPNPNTRIQDFRSDFPAHSSPAVGTGDRRGEGGASIAGPALLRSVRVYVVLPARSGRSLHETREGWRGSEGKRGQTRPPRYGEVRRPLHSCRYQAASAGSGASPAVEVCSLGQEPALSARQAPRIGQHDNRFARQGLRMGHAQNHQRCRQNPPPAEPRRAITALRPEYRKQEAGPAIIESTMRSTAGNKRFRSADRLVGGHRWYAVRLRLLQPFGGQGEFRRARVRVFPFL